ncbi:hypothetical protein SFRURICE_004456, partial [Spodoptera frugiperda]
MGCLFFCIFCAYALSFWFGYRLIRRRLLTNYREYNKTAAFGALIGWFIRASQSEQRVFFGVMTGSANFGISSTLME